MYRPKHQGLGEFDRALWRDLFGINLFTPMRLAELLLPSLEAAGSGRIVNISSELGSLERNTHGGLYAYRASKAALNAISKSLAIDLAGRGIIAVALSPGWVRTDMGGSGAELDVETSVRGMRNVIDGLKAEDSGKFLSWDGSELPW
jgi:NAD(P)-dependent dehydrogenase (short-subunit alcohol dehydrogenase family)